MWSQLHVISLAHTVISDQFITFDVFLNILSVLETVGNISNKLLVQLQW